MTMSSFFQFIFKLFSKSQRFQVFSIEKISIYYRQTWVNIVNFLQTCGISPKKVIKGLGYD